MLAFATNRLYDIVLEAKPSYHLAINLIQDLVKFALIEFRKIEKIEKLRNCISYSE